MFAEQSPLRNYHSDVTGRKRMRSLRTCFFALLATWAAAPLQALACSCWHPEPDEFLSSARLIFRGIVTSIESGSPQGAMPVGAGGVTIRGPQSGMRAKFQVSKLWKGSAGEEVEVAYTQSDGANCGWSFKVGQDVMVIASKSPAGVYSTSMCSMTPFSGGQDSVFSSALTAYREKLDGLNQRLQENPREISALRERSRLFAQYRDFAEADEDYGRLLAVAPKDLGATLGRANARYQTMKWEGALADFDLALALKPGDAEAQRGRTRTLIKMERPDLLGPKDKDFSGFDSGYARRFSFAGLDLRGATFKGAKLNSVDFTRADLRGADFTNADLHLVNFTDAKLERAKFDGVTGAQRTTFKGVAAQFASFKKANLFLAKFDEAVLVKADFEGAILESVSIKGAAIRGANFKNSSWVVANLSGTEWDGQDLSGADLRGANLNGTSLRNVNLRGARLTSEYALLIGDWRGADLSSADLSEVKWGPIVYDCRTKFPAGIKPETLPLLPLWGGCEGPVPATTLRGGFEHQRGPRLDKMQVQGAKLANMDLSGFGFWSTNLDHSDFRGANLAKADFQSGSYDGARFDGANLKKAFCLGTDFKGASFAGADLSEARLDHVDLSRANVNGAVLRDTCFTARTQWPADFDPLAAGAKLCR